jgi:hypothetical protein|uniref:Uncharacterized protein n=1 Tax=Mimiviridae sp. ChoanoV1 TaxID=2596887 RepID=A0A5B8IE93_9VIRU|nr:hypothetical protein 5_63 [Mimiviridae sp. ChoanoV1]
MNNNSEILINALIVGILLYLVFRFIIQFSNQSSESGSIVIGCLTCIYLVAVNEFKK